MDQELAWSSRMETSMFGCLHSSVRENTGEYLFNVKWDRLGFH